MASSRPLKGEFDADMRSILDREAEVGLCSTRFRQMVEQYGGLEAAKRLLQPDRQLPPDTFSFLRRIGRLDLTMESYVVQDKYRSLFSDEERQIAQWRLDYEN